MRLCEPAVSAEVEIEAVPALRVAVPSGVAPSRKVTVPPVGVVGPVTLATVAVSVVDCPNTDGLTELVRVVVVFSTTTKVPVSVGVSVATAGAGSLHRESRRARRCSRRVGADGQR